MHDTRIPENQWQSFCEGFTRQHHGWLVGLYQLDTRAVESGQAPAGERVRLYSGERPLQELRDGRTGDRAEFMVTVGEGADETSFLIEDAVALFSRTQDGAHQGVRVDSGNGKTTVVEFRVAAEPEALDGLAESER